jgi:uncharacterized protein YkwD
VAQRRATDMATRDYFSHTNPDGYAANYFVQQAGYILPSSYGQNDDSNNIECIAAGSSAANLTWFSWMDSPAHKEVLLGEIEFYELQDEYGVGYAFNAGATYDHYWVILTARQG